MPLRNWNGDDIPPTGKSFEVDFYTVAQWDDGQIVEENLMYDLVLFMQQLGLERLTHAAEAKDRAATGCRRNRKAISAHRALAPTRRGHHRLFTDPPAVRMGLAGERRRVVGHLLETLAPPIQANDHRAQLFGACSPAALTVGSSAKPLSV